MPAFDKTAILNMDPRYRVNFINSLSGFKSLNLVGSQNQQGQTNLAPFSSVVHLGADPALIGMVSRPGSVDRHTLENILETHCYTLNHVTPQMVEQAHQCSARYPREQSEFEASGLKPHYLDDFEAPFVADAAIKMAIAYREHHELAINGTCFIIGEIQAVYLPEYIVRPSGFIDLEQAETVCCSGLDSYHSTTRLSRLSYAKPDKAPTAIAHDE